MRGNRYIRPSSLDLQLLEIFFMHKLRLAFIPLSAGR
jgi:hypothetical protein